MRLIDADELKIDYGFTYSDITPTHEEMYALIDRQKTVESVRKKGHWEDVPHKSVEHGEVIIDGKTVCCSVCRHAYKGWNKGMNFCPNCGADMREES